jgi:hypothetical protein
MEVAGAVRADIHQLGRSIVGMGLKGREAQAQSQRQHLSLHECISSIRACTDVNGSMLHKGPPGEAAGAPEVTVI